jgi:hypothetical protein
MEPELIVWSIKCHTVTSLAQHQEVRPPATGSMPNTYQVLIKQTNGQTGRRCGVEGITSCTFFIPLAVYAILWTQGKAFP